MSVANIQAWMQDIFLQIYEMIQTTEFNRSAEKGQICLTIDKLWLTTLWNVLIYFFSFLW